MKCKIFCIIIGLFFIFSSISTLGLNTSTENKKLSTMNLGSAELPEWFLNNYWKYQMDFDFITRNNGNTQLAVDAAIDNMYAIVESVKVINSDEVYVMSLDGDISGEVTLFEAEISLVDFRGDFGGYAYIGKRDLGILQFEFTVDGQVNIPILGWRDMDFEMEIGFDQCFDFCDFPIHDYEDPWTVHIDSASLYAHVDIDIPLYGEHDYDSSMVFNDEMSLHDIKTVNVPAGSFESYIIGGTWGYESELAYAPDAGYLVQVDEGLLWNDGRIESVFHLNLLETNYVMGNIPPNRPDKPYGETNGEVETQYTYRTKTTDDNGDSLYYLFDWGDGTDSGWIGPYQNNEVASASHEWYKKGMYSVTVQAKDESGIKSEWSEPLSVNILGDPKIKFYMHRIEQTDDIDVTSEPDMYYEVSAISEGQSSPPQMNSHKNGAGEWIQDDIWAPNPDIEHEFIAFSRYVTIKFRLMDHDDMWEDPVHLGADDLADVSGCSGDGVDNFEDIPRGAVYHGTYDVATDSLKEYQTGAAGENADYVYKDNGYYITSGENQPDNSISTDGNDAKLWFRLESDYQPPYAIAQVMDMNGRFRPNVEIQFIGSVMEGTPDYSWHWDFDDGSTSEDQNPVYIFESDGTYQVELTVTDGFEQISKSTISVKVENIAPILTKDKVEPNKGSTNDNFVFSVHYFDPDQDIPTVKNLVLDGKDYILGGTGANDDYELQIKGSEIGKGNHRFYFYFEDGYGGNVQTSEKSFSVDKSKSKNFEHSLKIREIIQRLINIINQEHLLRFQL